MTQLSIRKNSTLPSFFDVFDNAFMDLPMVSIFGNSEKYQKVPQTKLKEFDDRHELYVSVPGIQKEELNIDVKNSRITISAETKSEFSYSSFKKSWYLPENVDQLNIKAKQENGILTVIMPKAKEKDGQKIEIE